MNLFIRRTAIIASLLSLWTGVSDCAHSAEFEIETGWNDQLFPAFVIATATIRLPEEALEENADEQVLGDPQGLLGVTLSAEEDDTQVMVTISCDAIMEESVFEGTLPVAGETYTIFPKIQYKFDELARRSQPGPVTVTYTVELGEEDMTSESRTLTLRSINDCPFTVVEGEDAIDVCFMFAAYVNEQHPYVDKILREALDTEIVDSFTGYQSGDKAEVYRQVYALWHTLTERDLRYSDVTTSSAESDSVYSQYVRMIDQSINNAQANCVDGSVLLASLLRKVGIEPVLVMVPGHCYLGFYLDQECSEIAGLETTLLGATLADGESDTSGITELVGNQWISQNSWRTFAAALSMGSKDLESNSANFEAGEDPDYQIISILAARRLGILPIAFQADNEFVPTDSEYDDEEEYDEDEEDEDEDQDEEEDEDEDEEAEDEQDDE